MARSTSPRYSAPRGASALIARPALQDRVEYAGKLVLLLAPPGAGKSSLLSQWNARFGASHRIAWLLCDARDREPAYFFSCLAASIDQALQCSARLGGDAIGVEGLAEKLGATEQDIFVVIDDLQCLDCAEGERALSSLILRSSPSVRWVLATRRAPRFDLQRLKLDDALTLLDAAELAFQSEEISALAQLLHGTELSPTEATACARRTEGWIAGVKLSLLERGERVEGLNHDISAYFAAAAWQDLSAPLRAFLLVTSVPERFCGELACALLEDDTVACHLDEVASLQLFVRALDSTHRWFRYHGLYREFLLAQLRKSEPARITQLHRVSSDWFARHDRPTEALQHAFQTSDRSWSVHVLARCVGSWLRTGEFPEVLQWTARLTQSEIMSCITVRDAHLMSLIFLRQFDRARLDLQAAEHAAQRAADAEAAPAAEAEVSGGGSSARKVMAGSSGIEASSELQRRALPAMKLMLDIMTEAGVQLTASSVEALSVAEDPYLSANLFNVAAYQLLVDKEFDAARRLALRGQELLQGSEHVYAAAQSSIVLMLIDRAEGHARAAAETCMQLYARTRTGRRNPIWVTATTAAASVHYHHNRLAQAEALCSEVLPLVSMAPSLENLTVAHVVAARLKCAAARYGEALRLLDYLHSVLESSNCQRLLARVCFEKVRLWLLQEQPLRALKVLADCGQSFHLEDIEATAQSWEEYALSRVAILIHRGSFETAAMHLQRLCERAEAAGDVYGRVRVEAALATCRWQAHEEEDALRWMNHALTLTDHRGFSRAVFDDVYGLPMVFAAALKSSRLAKLPPADYFKRFQDVLAFDPYEHRPTPESAPVLTQRELDLLKLVSMGLSNRDISQRSNITLLTTKWHLKNVFAKLGVSTRMEAVFRAQELQLVDGRPPSPLAR
ncbi:hypothetical protein JM946_16950 [Steroidobacter sp. S1-65]|uniref:HTH luxR-type domain-containing protein n=1 Tax=Steroidobacter gossypii TaxID=2805490 RepID=A0ABS1WZN5_9GAMM|nr:LuxR C-terminal-related transcriptional regulator [Steroidobacter gossypii]MBM0106423.1 hypothetical protein [Steroidobacter gossypii]